VFKVHNNSVTVELSKSFTGTIVIYAKMVFAEDKVANGKRIIVTFNEALTDNIPATKDCPGLDTTKAYDCKVHIHLTSSSPLCEICKDKNWRLE
jgi:hypothetical protein